MANSHAKTARLVVLLLILVALAAGVYARYGIGGRGVLTIRNDSREPTSIRYMPAAGPKAPPPIETRLDPGQTVVTTFRSGAVLEVWLGEIRPDQPAAWRIRGSGPWILINLEQFQFRLDGEGLDAESLTPVP